MTYFTFHTFIINHSLGELNFNEDLVHLLLSHSAGDTATYGYHFLPYVTPSKENQFMALPGYLKNSADHADELAYLFGVPWTTDDMSEVYKGMFSSTDHFFQI